MRKNNRIFIRIDRVVLIALFALISAGCATSAPSGPTTLQAPPDAKPAAADALQEGNRRYAAVQWEAAELQYEEAIKLQPTLAEAHYNLALTLEKLGRKKEAYAHYIEAANLAPGNKVIWDSPPLREYGNVKAKPSSDMPTVMPSIGGLGPGMGGTPQ